MLGRPSSSVRHGGPACPDREHADTRVIRIRAVCCVKRAVVALVLLIVALSLAFTEPKPRQHVQTISGEAPRYEYAIPVGGTLDMDSTLTRSHGNIEVAFQNNLSLTIANVGDTPVVHPRLVINDRGDWWTFESMLAEFTRDATTEQERAMLIWERMREPRYHQVPLFGTLEMHDPVKMLGIYGHNLCGQIGNAGVALFLAAGLEGSHQRAMFGHVQCEAMVDGRLQFLDIDQDCFYLDRENERPVGGDELARDADLVRRELNYGPLVDEFKPSWSTAGLLGPDDIADARPPTFGHDLLFTLRPGERVEFRWDNRQKWASEGGRFDKEPVYYANSIFTYDPRLDSASVERDSTEHAGLVEVEGGLAAETAGELVYEVSPAFVIAGGTVEAAFDCADAADRVAIDLSLDGEDWHTLWEGGGPGEYEAGVSLEEALQVRREPAKYRYFLRVRLDPADALSARLTDLRIDTIVMASPLFIPRLRVGENTCVYEDDTAGPRQVRIVHRWRESDAVTPPAPPGAPAAPVDGAEVRQSLVRYEWPAVEGCDRYHIRVSRREDFAWPYRPSLDVIIPSTEWKVPFTGTCAPGTYLWRVRARTAGGVWGPWSDTWRFTWRGPRVPVNLSLEMADGVGTLHWEANPRGERPIRYAVYASDVRGFSVSREPYEVKKLRDMPPNLLGETEGTSMTVITPEPESGKQNRVFYRVAAIDAAGVESGCSDFTEAPHPLIWTQAQPATVGKPWEYQARSLRSYGDLQRKFDDRHEKWRYDYFDIEKLAWEIVDGPEWLSIDQKLGTLTGTPPEAGTYPVTIAAETQFGGRDEQGFEVGVR